MKYLREEPPDPKWTREAFALQLRGKITAKIIVTGKSRQLVAYVQCPRCDGSFDVDRASDATYVSAGRLGDGSVPTGPSSSAEAAAREVIICAGSPVEGTPEGCLGCGAAFSIYAEVTPLGESS